MQITHRRHVISGTATCVVMRVVRIIYLSLNSETKVSHLGGCFLKLACFMEAVHHSEIMWLWEEALIDFFDPQS